MPRFDHLAEHANRSIFGVIDLHLVCGVHALIFIIVELLNIFNWLLHRMWYKIDTDSFCRISAYLSGHHRTLEDIVGHLS